MAALTLKQRHVLITDEDFQNIMEMALVEVAEEVLNEDESTASHDLRYRYALQCINMGSQLNQGNMAVVSKRVDSTDVDQDGNIKDDAIALRIARDSFTVLAGGRHGGFQEVIIPLEQNPTFLKRLAYILAKVSSAILDKENLDDSFYLLAKRIYASPEQNAEVMAISIIKAVGDGLTLASTDEDIEEAVTKAINQAAKGIQREKVVEAKQESVKKRD